MSAEFSLPAWEAPDDVLEELVGIARERWDQRAHSQHEANLR